MIVIDDTQLKSGFEMQRYMIIIILLLVCGLGYAGGADWMARVDDDKLLSELSVPGTHNSGAMYEPLPGTAKCQNLTIGGQLEIGVRFLDVRCRHVKDSFDIYHGIVYQKISFQDVVDECVKFLEANPTETIIMSVQQVGRAMDNSRSFVETFKSYVGQEAERWCLEDKIPKLGEVRGRIVLFRRFGGVSDLGMAASAWRGGTFEIKGAAAMRVQDKFFCRRAGQKWDSVLKMLEDAAAGEKGKLYVNFSSGYVSGLLGLPDITSVSDVVNAKLKSYLKDKAKRRYGIIVMDFVDEELAEEIIEEKCKE